MSRSLAAWMAVVVLTGLTLVTWQLGDADASAWLLAGVALLKILLIGAVFLELTRSWPVWGALFASSVVGVLGLCAWLLSGP